MYLARLTALAAAFSALAFSAQAVSVTLLDGSPQGMGSNTAHLYASGYAGNSPAWASFSDDPLVTPPPGNLSGVYQSPFNNTPLADSQTYFSVGAVNGDNGAASPVTLTFGSPVDSFTILWGSIDSYNTIAFFSGATLLEDYTGTDIINAAMLGGTPINYEQVALLRFSDFGEGGLTSVRFSSTQAAFEFALAAPAAAVPLPASVFLLLGALGGFGLLSRRRQASPA
jgi:hypothetical protein